MMEGKTPIVEIKNLNKSYRRGTQVVPVLHDITFDINEVEFLVLMGPSGSGKTTLLNLIAGIDRQTAVRSRSGVLILLCFLKQSWPSGVPRVWVSSFNSTTSSRCSLPLRMWNSL